MITLNPQMYELNRCYLSGSNAQSSTTENTSNQQVGVASGGAGLGSYSNGNIVNVTTSDVNALEANQNVSESAINSNSSVATYAIQSLEQSAANQNVVTVAALDNNTAQANDAENVANTVSSEGLSLASQVAAGSGYGTQTGSTVNVSNSPAAATAAPSGGISTVALWLGVLVSAVTIWYYLEHK